MSHHFITRNPMSEARRQHLHGPLVSLAKQARDAGEPSLLVGASVLLAIVVIATFLFTAFAGA